MPYNETRATRVRQALSRLLSTERKLIEKRTIGGGLLFMLDGHMCCSVWKASLMVRVGPQSYEQVLKLPHTQPLEFGGKAPLGYVCIDPEGFETEKDLRVWIQRGIDFVSTLSAKQASAKKSPAKKSSAKKRSPAKR